MSHLEHLLNVVRGISKIEGAYLPKENIPVKNFTQNIAASVLKSYQGTSIEIQTKNLPETILIQPDYYERILSNLIENAASFAKHIRVALEKTASGKAQTCLVIKVSDDGPGINEDDMAKIFNRFYSNRSHSLSDSESKIGHTGLGLAIVKAICDELEGQITVGQDQELGGALFKINLPLEA